MSKAWSYLTSKKKRTVWWRAFRMWQRRPPVVAPIVVERRECASCGTAFCGNYCPRCGQAAGVGRFSFKKAFQLFMDVWGMGNRSMFRSMRDLVLRPGYMIRDYIGGMQSAYFPPFKMFFVLAAISMLVEHGLGLNLNETDDTAQEPQIEIVQEPQGDKQQIASEGEPTEQADSDDGQQSKKHYIVNLTQYLRKLKDRNPAIVSLIALLLFSWPLYFFLRKSPTIPDLRFSEFVVLLVYTSNGFSILSIVGNLLNSSLIKFIAFIMIFVALKQFSGYTKRRLLGYSILTFLISGSICVAVVGAGVWIAYNTVWQ